MLKVASYKAILFSFIIVISTSCVNTENFNRRLTIEIGRLKRNLNNKCVIGSLYSASGGSLLAPLMIGLCISPSSIMPIIKDDPSVVIVPAIITGTLGFYVKRKQGLCQIFILNALASALTHNPPKNRQRG